MMKHPIWLALGLGLAVVLAALAPPLWQALSHRGAAAPATAAAEGAEGGSGPGRAGDDQLPWAVQALGNGRSRVFGLNLGQASLADVQRRFGDLLQLALVARLGEPATLEALVEPMAAGFVSGRLVLGFAAPPEQLARWRAHSPRSEPMAGGARRFALRPQDLAEAAGLPLSHLGFVPSVRLTEADVRQRFGAPAETRALADAGALLLYPERGLLVQVSPGSRGLLQYVAPAEFERRLRAPLAATTP